MAISWVKNAGELAAMALGRVTMIGAGLTIDAHRWVIFRDHLNGLLKLLQTQGPSEWRRSTLSVTLVAGTAGYALTPRPDRVQTARYCDVSGYETPLAPWAMNEYESLPIKTSPGRPVIYAIDRQRTSTMIYFWNVPDASAATGTVKVSCERVIEDIATVDDAIDVPQEWLDMLADVLGARMASSFRISNKDVDEVRARGSASLEAVLGYDRERSITFTFEREE